METASKKEKTHVTAYTTKDGRSPGFVAGALHGGRRAGAGQAADALLGGMGSGERARRIIEGLHGEERHSDEVRVRSLDELRRPLSQRTELEGQAVRPDHRRQPVD